VDWVETYRGVVKAWECDVVAHFTIAYYFERFADTAKTYLELTGLHRDVPVGTELGNTRLFVTFENELRAGAAFHIRSAVTGVNPDVLTLGHQVVDTASGKTVTWASETLRLPPTLPRGVLQQLEALVVPWPGPETPEPTPARSGGMLSSRERVKPQELDENGLLSPADQVHRYSAASMHTMTAVGITSDFMVKNRRGFSTFGLDFVRSSTARIGELADVTSSIAHVGKSSLRMQHRMTAADGREISTLVQSGVLLDMDLRRSTAIPDELRPAIEKLLLRN